LTRGSNGNCDGWTRRPGGEPVKSNVTDNESGKIKGPHGVIQGYDGLAVADSKNQIIVAAQANGTVAEVHFAAALDEAAGNPRTVSGKRKPLEGTNGSGGHGVFQRGQFTGGEGVSQKMREAIDKPRNRKLYGRWIQILGKIASKEY
jgi:hypothetical protein